VRCGDKAKDLYDTAQLEEKQNNKPHATKLYRRRQEIREIRVSPDRRAIREKIETDPKIRKWFQDLVST
jgi:hypothetical protein